MWAAAAVVLVAAVLFAGCGGNDPAKAGESFATTTNEMFRLSTHCGVLSTSFAGRRWLADPPVTDGSGNPPDGWGNPFEEGTMTLVAPDVAVFSGRSGHKARFVPLPEGRPDPAEGCL